MQSSVVDYGDNITVGFEMPLWWSNYCDIMAVTLLAEMIHM
jgi:hypothetical protein